jgi:hypothetical protein
MNVKREPAHLADDYCDEHGLNRVDPDDVAVLDAFLAWIEGTGRADVWQMCLDLYDDCLSRELAHDAFHEIAGWQTCELNRCAAHPARLSFFGIGSCDKCDQETVDATAEASENKWRRRCGVPPLDQKSHLRLVRGGGA